MARRTFVWHPETGEMIPKEDYVRPGGGPRGKFPTPRLSLDTMDPVRSMLDGKYYDSKAALRSTYKAAGVTEVGNDVQFERKKPERDQAAVRKSVGQAMTRAGYSF